MQCCAARAKRCVNEIAVTGPRRLFDVLAAGSPRLPLPQVELCESDRSYFRVRKTHGSVKRMDRSSRARTLGQVSANSLFVFPSVSSPCITLHSTHHSHKPPLAVRDHAANNGQSSDAGNFQAHPPTDEACLWPLAKPPASPRRNPSCNTSQHPPHRQHDCENTALHLHHHIGDTQVGHEAGQEESYSIATHLAKSTRAVVIITQLARRRHISTAIHQERGIAICAATRCRRQIIRLECYARAAR